MKRLISFSTNSLRASRAALERSIGSMIATTPGLPPIIRLGAHKAVDETLADKFIDSIIECGGLPKQPPFTPQGAAANRRKSQPPKRKSARAARVES